MIKRFLSRNMARAIRGLSPEFRPDPSRVRILVYHGVGRLAEDPLSVSEKDFLRQMELLKESGYETISLDDLLSPPPQNSSKPRVLLTFDDGYENVFLKGFPIMRKMGFKGTIFLIVRAIGTPKWMNLQEIQQMLGAGFEFGSHTVTHPFLPHLSREQQKKELLESREKLSALIGRDVIHFCYPYGAYDRGTIALLRECGYRSACTNVPGINHDDRIRNPFLLKRTEIMADDTLEDFCLKISGAYDFPARISYAFRPKSFYNPK